MALRLATGRFRATRLAMLAQQVAADRHQQVGTEKALPEGRSD
jgi:hypothetical protein